MFVLVTAGHVDHGKSTLVRALTGMEPDRWAEERRRGMTIDLGFAWTTLPSGAAVAFVDVPGHERFVPNMLAGVGPVPAALLVVAADEGWKPQSAEHLAALDALGVRHGLLVVSRADLADPGPATAQALKELAGSSLDAVAAVAVSPVTGQGLDELRTALENLVRELPEPDADAPVRLWIDRAFTIKGAGTVVTGTLGAGRLRTGDELELDGRPVKVRGLQSLGEPAAEVTATARVAVNLRGVDKDSVHRGSALLTPGTFLATDLIDIRLHGDPVAELPTTLTLHAGSASISVRVRPLGEDTARLRLAQALPLRLGDRMLLRDPGSHRIAGGATVLDVVPPGLTRRGAAAARATDLAAMTGTPDLPGELRRRKLVRRTDLTRMGITAPGTDQWLADPEHWANLQQQLASAVHDHAAAHPLDDGIPLEALRHRLALPDRALVEALLTPPLTVRGGRVTATARNAVPQVLASAVDKAFAGLADRPFAAPDTYVLQEAGLGVKQLAAAVRAGLLIRLGPAIVLRADAATRAVDVLRRLPQPFTLSEARQALDTSRRVIVPLLEHLDATGATHRLPDDRRTVP